MAVATDREYGLVIGGELAEPASGEFRDLIEPATGDSLARTALVGGYKQSGFGRELALETLDLYLETKSVVVSTGARPINPFGL